jgi:hypothetical protein
VNSALKESKIRYRANREHVLERVKRWGQANRERMRECSKKWREGNPERNVNAQGNGGINAERP